MHARRSALDPYTLRRTSQRVGGGFPRLFRLLLSMGVVLDAGVLYSARQSSPIALCDRRLVSSNTAKPHIAVKLPAAELDEILALQLTVAWAGESAGDPPRLGWWKSDLIDSEGGGDLFTRLAPRTAIWASLILARKAAVRVDELARGKLAHQDRARTLFHFGFQVDEQLSDRLIWHRNHQSVPREVFGSHFLVGSAWSRPHLEALLAKLGKPKVTVTPSGRQLAGLAQSPVEAARLFASALLPLSSEYPLPFAEVSA